MSNILNTLIEIRDRYHLEVKRCYSLKTKKAIERSRDLLQSMRREFFDAVDKAGVFKEGDMITLNNAVFSIVFGSGVGGISGKYKIIGAHGTMLVLDADGEAVKIELIEKPMGHDQLRSISLAA